MQFAEKAPLEVDRRNQEISIHILIYKKIQVCVNVYPLFRKLGKGG
jgi:hypothetical protein